MQVVVLSDHPKDMQQESRQRRTAGTAQEQSRHADALALHAGRVAAVRRSRDEARARRRWLAWLGAVLGVWRERRRVPAAPRLAGRPSEREHAIAGGIEGERLAAEGLGRSLGDEWTLLRGYRNRRGEIDHLLLGPRGLFAIESKYRNATVTCTGDRWQYARYDRYGNLVDGPAELISGGRSPSEQLNEPASELEDFLRSRGHPVAIERIVLFNHPRSQVGTCTSPTVHIATSTDQVISVLNRSPAAITVDERTELEQLITHDHQHHNARRRTN
jgi:Nuclease-related domain